MELAGHTYAPLPLTSSAGSPKYVFGARPEGSPFRMEAYLPDWKEQDNKVTNGVFEIIFSKKLQFILFSILPLSVWAETSREAKKFEKIFLT